MRVLDLDLDFFVHDAAHWRNSADARLDETASPPWTLDETMAFLTDRCGLTRPLPGFVVEHHGELFGRWRKAMRDERLAMPLSVTHVDAHADLGLGDSGWVHLMTDVLLRPLADRHDPVIGDSGGVIGLGDGNWLAYAIACRWLSDLTYVYNDDGGNDLMIRHHQDWDPAALNLQLKGFRADRKNELMAGPGRRPKPDALEPTVPFRHMQWQEYRTNEPFEIVCLARSPGFTPPTSDPLFDEIRRTFIDEVPFH